MVLTTWHERTALVTGASGLLGSALVEALLERRARVVCLIRDWVPDSRLLAAAAAPQGHRAVLVRGELEDFPLLARVVNEYEIDTVFHLGAQTIVGTAARGPLSTFEANVRGTWCVLEACRAAGGLVERIVIASSDKAYGRHDALPYREELPLEGRFPYDASKACAELIARSYHHTYGLPLAITRCGNLFGPGDLNFNRLVPGTIRAALSGQRPVVRSDGTYVRDYFYVRDAAAAYLALADALPRPELLGEAVNFGTQTPLSVLEMVERILLAAGRPELVPDVRNEAHQEIPRQTLDTAKARRLLGWQPQWDLVAALAETVDWYRAYLGR